MAPTNADSFNATGPTVVAFETISDTQRIGAGVQGTLCGVYGTSASGLGSRPDQSRDTNIQDGIGVIGVGAFAGVYGSGPVGVNGAGDREGVLASSNHGTGVVATSQTGNGVDATGAGFGVTAVGNSAGVKGKIGPKGSFNSAAIYGEAANSAGQLCGVGVRGWSLSSRGGVFATGEAQYIQPQFPLGVGKEPVAQVHLIPISAPNPPKKAAAGDLLALRSTTRRVRAPLPVELWFCVKSSTATVPATWVKLA